MSNMVFVYDLMRLATQSDFYGLLEWNFNGRTNRLECSINGYSWFDSCRSIFLQPKHLPQLQAVVSEIARRGLDTVVAPMLLFCAVYKELPGDYALDAMDDETAELFKDAAKGKVKLS